MRRIRWKIVPDMDPNQQRQWNSKMKSVLAQIRPQARQAPDDIEKHVEHEVNDAHTKGTCDKCKDASIAFVVAPASTIIKNADLEQLEKGEPDSNLIDVGSTHINPEELSTKRRDT